MRKQKITFEVFPDTWTCHHCLTINPPIQHACRACHTHQQYQNVAVKVLANKKFVCIVRETYAPDVFSLVSSIQVKYHGGHHAD